MARDYGTKRTARRSNNAPKQLLVVIVTFLLGYLTASIWDVNTLSHWMTTQVLASHEQKKQEPVSASQHAQVAPKPKFEFYTLLANEKGVGATQAATSGVHPAATTPVQTASNTAVNSAATATRALGKSHVQPAVPVKVAEGNALKPNQASSPANKGSYLVQVASFKMRKDAEHMKGLLILKGFNVSIVPVSQARGNWFRVVIGPYPNRLSAQKAQMNLAKTEGPEQARYY
ncbi:MAG: SPOR domain-containing protein [bacterium]|nr:SPOR domain-containing protein [bacterium]